MEQTPGTTAGGAEEGSRQESPPAAAAGGGDEQRPSFAARARARRRARYLRRARELAYRDLGGLVFSLHRFGARNDALVLAKLTTLEQIDRELRALEDTLAERQPVTVLREAGITACARCAAIHSSEDRFCPNCGLALGRSAERPAELRSPASASTHAAAVHAAQAQAPASAPGDPSAPLPAEPSAPPYEPAAAPAAEPAIPPLEEPPGTLDTAAAGPPAAAIATEGQGTAAEESHEDAATVIIRPSASGP